MDSQPPSYGNESRILIESINGKTSDYTNWDLTRVDIADIIYVYAEVDNPSCIGLAVEVGWAAKAGKTIVYVEPDDHPKHTSLGMVRALANYRSNNFYDSIYILESIVNPKEPS